jgi:hypothetical protein
MASSLAQVLITLTTSQLPVPAGITAGPLSAVVTDSTGAAQPAVSIPATGPYSFTTTLPVSADGVTVSASLVMTSTDSTGAPIVAPGNPSAAIALTLTEATFALATGATMVLTPAGAAANPNLAAAAKRK